MQEADLARLREVFPTHVGVFPFVSRLVTALLCLPHARGGVSCARMLAKLVPESSPRTWGCFCRLRPRCCLPGVFPTHVGVFPSEITGAL